MKRSKEIDDVIRRDGWVCACIKRDWRGRMTHLKMHHPSVVKCRVCGCAKDESEQVAKGGAR